MITCGDFGGITKEGAPCGLQAGSGTPRKGYGRCKQHETALKLHKDRKKNAFLVAYSLTGNVSRAAGYAQMSRLTHYLWMREDPEYVEAFEQAKEIAGDELETEARRRAMFGTEKPVYYEGRQIGTLREYSDTLLIFLLKGARPHVYRERVEHTGKDGGPIQMQHVDWSKLTNEQCERIRNGEAVEDVLADSRGG